MQNTRNSSSPFPEYNGRGDKISPKREAKRQFKKKFGITTGRQYRKMRKALQRGELG